MFTTRYAIRPLKFIWIALIAAIARLDKSFSPSHTFRRVRKHEFTLSDYVYIVFHVALSIFWLYLMENPSYPKKLLIPFLHILGVMVPFTSQFFVPATPVFAWLTTFYTSRFIPESWRPSVFVVLLPTLENVLYGGNISDSLRQYTHPILDVLAWLPYGVIHLMLPFVMALVLWLFRPKQALHQWARLFGWMNLLGVFVQIILPCAPPWYEMSYGVMPASYAIRGSAAGLARIDDLAFLRGLSVGGGYQAICGASSVVFGAFPSLHVAWAVLGGLFVIHFFPGPNVGKVVGVYVLVLCWATMYLEHHYLVDVVGGAGLAVTCFYVLLPDEVKGPFATSLPYNLRVDGAFKKFEEPLPVEHRDGPGQLENGMLDESSRRHGSGVGMNDRCELVWVWRAPEQKMNVVLLFRPNRSSNRLKTQ